LAGRALGDDNHPVVDAVAERASGDPEAAAATRDEAAAIGERFGDSDLFVLAAHEQGHILIETGCLREGLGLLDEAMVAVTAGSCPRSSPASCTAA
jgi:hypothetical protein